VWPWLRLLLLEEHEQLESEHEAGTDRIGQVFFFTLVTGPRRSLSLTSIDTRGYEPQTRAIGQVLSPNPYRGTSLIRNTPPVGPYSRPMPIALW